MPKARCSRGTPSKIETFIGLVAAKSGSVPRPMLARNQDRSRAKAAGVMSSEVCAAQGQISNMANACHAGIAQACEDLSREQAAKDVWIKSMDPKTFEGEWGAAAEVVANFAKMVVDEDEKRDAWLAKQPRSAPPGGQMPPPGQGPPAGQMPPPGQGAPAGQMQPPGQGPPGGQGFNGQGPPGGQGFNGQGQGQGAPPGQGASGAGAPAQPAWQQGPSSQSAPAQFATAPGQGATTGAPGRGGPGRVWRDRSGNVVTRNSQVAAASQAAAAQAAATGQVGAPRVPATAAARLVSRVSPTSPSAQDAWGRPTGPSPGTMTGVPQGAFSPGGARAGTSRITYGEQE